MPEIKECPHCGLQSEHLKILVCPQCDRYGCCCDEDENPGCMPAGNNCVCPECEDGEDD